MSDRQVCIEALRPWTSKSSTTSIFITSSLASQGAAEFTCSNCSNRPSSLTLPGTPHLWRNSGQRVR
jgi:hypothetical protein